MRPSYGLGLSIECYTGCRPWETPIRSLLLFLFHMKKRKDSPAITHQLIRNKSILRARILKAKRIISDVRDRKRLAEFLKYGKIYH